MTNPFFEHPILNSPYAYPARYWELDQDGQPTQRIIESRRHAEFITPIPRPRKRKTSEQQKQIVFDEGKGLSTEKQQYDPTPIINEMRSYVSVPERMSAMTMKPVLHSFTSCLDVLREQVADVPAADMVAQRNGIMNCATDRGRMKVVKQEKDTDGSRLTGVEAALRRAGRRARELAAKTGTPLGLQRREDQEAQDSSRTTEQILNSTVGTFVETLH